MRLALAIACVAATLLVATCQQPLGPCQTTDDCLAQEVCFEGQCRHACESNAHCQETQHCLQGACLDLGGTCASDGDCLGVETCVDGHCRLRCTSSSTCPEGTSCLGGVCLPARDGGTPDDGGPEPDLKRYDGASVEDADPGERPPQDGAAAEGGALDSPRADQQPPDAAPQELPGQDGRLQDAMRVDAARVDRSPPDLALPDLGVPDTLRRDAQQPDRSLPDVVLPDTAQPDRSAPDTAQPDMTPPDRGDFDAAMHLACIDQYGAASGFVLCAADDQSCSFNALNSGTTCHNTCRLFGGLCLDALDNNTTPGAECIDTGGVTDCATNHINDICVCTRDWPLPSCDLLYGAVREYMLCAEDPQACTFYARTAGTSCNELCNGIGHACLAAANHQNGQGNECSPTQAVVDCDNVTATQICTCERAAPRPGCDALYGTAPGYVLCEESFDSCRFYALTNAGSIEHSCGELCATFGGTCLDADDDAQGEADVGGVCDTSSTVDDCSSLHADQICVCSK